MLTVITQVYNTPESYLRQCIESVLKQTYPCFEYILIDNGCTDGSSDILREYEKQDRRIRLIRFEKNRNTGLYMNILQQNARGTFCTVLDSDDWWELEYLERLVDLMEETDADIVCTGTLMHVEGTHQTSLRTVSERRLLHRLDYSEAFPAYHQFFRTVWGKVFRTNILQDVDLEKIDRRGMLYGNDTLTALAMLRHADKIILDNSILHNYRIRKESNSSQYDPRRFDSDVYLYNDAIDFLSAYGPVSERNKDFLARVYANAVSDTVNVIYHSGLSPEEQLREYRRIAEHPITQENYRRQHEDIDRSRKNLTAVTLNCNGVTDEAAVENFRAAVEELIPRCAPVVTPQSIPLFGRENLLRAVLDDDVELILSKLLELIRAQKDTKKYDLYAMVRALSADNPLLRDIDDKKFLRRYGDIYLSVWRGRYVEALDAMTGVLLNGEDANEVFLNLYLSLAALENQPSAFVYGKIQLAKLYLRQGSKDACRAVLDELAEMGVEESEEIAALRQALA